MAINQDKLHWIVKHKSNFKDEDDFLETILMDCGIKREDISKFLNPNRTMINDPFLMKNMQKLIERIHIHVHKGSKIAILPDADNDGMCSGAILGQFLENDLNVENVIYIFSEGKAHGLEYNLIKNFKQGDIDLFIIPDASITMPELNLIQKNFPNMEILVIDHHLVTTEYLDTETGKWILEKEANEISKKEPDRIKKDKYINYIISVNSNDGEYPNNSLSGGGVCQKVIEAYSKTYPDDCPDNCIFKYLDLVSLAICGDNMDLRDLETRFYVIEGMKRAFRNNQFFNELQDRLSDEMKFDRYIGSAQWVLIPKVNGVIRFGKAGKKGELSEKEQLFYAMLNRQGTVEYKPRRKSKNDPEPEIEKHTLAWDAARMAVNVKARQDNEVRKYSKEIQEKIEQEHLDVNSVIFVDGTKAVERGETTGLIANKLATEYHRPIVLMREFDSKTYGGSCRGYSKGNIKNLKEFLESTGKISVFGHENAAGIKFQKDDLNDIIKEINEKMPLNTLYTEHQVDWEIPAIKLKREYISEVAERYEIWGNTVPEPVFAITNLIIEANQINGYGEHNSFIRFNYNEISFTKKYCKSEDFDRMICKQRTTIGKPKYKVKLNLICQFVLNAWEDKVNPEVKILYFDSEKYEGALEEDWLEEDSNYTNNNNGSNNISISDTITSNIFEKQVKKEIEEKTEEPVKKKRGRPRKNPLPDSEENNSLEKVTKKGKNSLEKVKMQKVEEFDEEEKMEEFDEKGKEENNQTKTVDNSNKKKYNIDDELDFDW